MAQRDKDGGKLTLSRRDFLKVTGAAAAAGATGMELAFTPSRAFAADVAAIYHTTCPYCSASCGQLVDVDIDGNVLDVYGDPQSPFNAGGLCAKGAGAHQLVTNRRRIGAFAGTHPVNSVFAHDAGYTDGIAYKRTGDGAWSKMDLTAAFGEIATAMMAARDANGAAPAAGNGYNSKQVAFFGSSHMNNEQNYAYRRLIAQFGTTNVEHQARI
ncbi:MAG: twin-arginine translocation signal domain-containing protein [Coriobacteriia bacterium]|nr:twin-arginine translocation signal domain-containing protein [Coriobacteriia bacterium]